MYNHTQGDTNAYPACYIFCIRASQWQSFGLIVAVTRVEGEETTELIVSSWSWLTVLTSSLA